MRNSKGITLIALAITIIVLLILAGVSLNFIVEENGILGRATKSVEKTGIAEGKEKAELLVSDFGIEFYEKKYGNQQNDLDDIDTYIKEKFSASGEETANGYIVSIMGKSVEVTKNEVLIATGTLENGKIIWDGEVVKRARPTRIYAYVYTDGTYSLSKFQDPDPTKEVKEVIGWLDEWDHQSSWNSWGGIPCSPWAGWMENMVYCGNDWGQVNVLDEIVPANVDGWFQCLDVDYYAQVRT